MTTPLTVSEPLKGNRRQKLSPCIFLPAVDSVAQCAHMHVQPWGTYCHLLPNLFKLGSLLLKGIPLLKPSANLHLHK